MTCEEVKEFVPLFLYGELSFDEEERLESHLERCQDCRRQLQRERALHTALDSFQMPSSPDLLVRSREQLRRTIGAGASHGSFWEKLRGGFTIHIHPIPAGLQPFGALALVAMGFFGARMLPSPAPAGGNIGTAGFTAPMASRVRYVEPGQSGKVQIVVEETRQRVLSGGIDDRNIQDLLVEAARDMGDAGLRVESVDLLKSRPQTPEVRDALLYVLQRDPNPGVRLKALEGLKNSSADPSVRQALTRVLLSDENPGVRTQAIDVLIQHKNETMVGALQELLRKENNGYVRLRCQKALHEMNASVETY